MPATATPTKTAAKNKSKANNTNNVSEVLLIDPKLIDVKEDFNPRKSFGGDDDAAFADNVKTYGVLQSLLVSKKEDGRYELIAGERRLRAALKANLAEVPVTIRESGDSSSTFALLENIQRRNLNPIEEAESMDLILKQTGIAKSRLAKALNVSPSHVTERLRLVSLDTEIQKAIIEGSLPVSATRFLEKVTNASPAAAKYVAKMLVEGRYRHMRTHPEDYASNLIWELRELANEENAKNFPDLDCVAVCGSRISPRSISVRFPKEQEELKSKWEEYSADYRWNYMIPDIDDAAIKAIGAAGALTDDMTVIFDRDTVIHLIDSAVIKWEKLLEEEAANAADRDAAVGGASNAAASAGKKSTPGDQNGESDHQRREREKQEAFVHNTNLGNNLLKKLSTIKPTLAIIKTLAIAYANENNDMAGLGIALTDERLQTKDETTFKNGNKKVKINYLTKYEAHDELIARIKRAKTVEEVLGTLFTAVVAATCVDNKALPVPDRASWHSSTFGSYGDEFASKELAKLQAKVIPKIDPAAKAGAKSTPAAK